jgi:DNA repair protein RadC
MMLYGTGPISSNKILTSIKSGKRTLLRDANKCLQLTNASIWSLELAAAINVHLFGSIETEKFSVVLQDNQHQVLLTCNTATVT